MMVYVLTRALFIVCTYLTQFQSSFWHYEYLLAYSRTNPRLYDLLLAISLSMVMSFYYILKLSFERCPLDLWKYFYLFWIYCLSSLMSNLVYGYKLKLWNHRLPTILQTRRSIASRQNLIANCENFYTEHTKICAHTLRGNGTFWGKMFFLFLVTNISLNLYFITHLWFDDLPFFRSSSLWCCSVYKRLLHSL